MLPKEFLCVCPGGGLGTRLHILSSFHAVALHIKIPLLVHWKASRGFNETAWHDLFQETNAFRLVSPREWEELHLQPGVLNLDLDDTKALKNFSLRWMFQGRFRQVCAVTSTALTSLDSALIYRHLPSYDKTMSTWARCLTPEPSLHARIRTLSNSYNADTTLGIHIRRNDATKGPLKKKIIQPTDDAYFERIVVKSMRLGHRVYLATDDQRIWDSFRNQFNEVIVGMDSLTRNDYEYSDTKNGQKDALIDLYCLSSCREVYGTNQSDFSFFAKLLHLNRSDAHLFSLRNETKPLVPTSEPVLPFASRDVTFFKNVSKVTSVWTKVTDSNVQECRFLLETLNYFEPGMTVVVFTEGKETSIEATFYPLLHVEIILDNATNSLVNDDHKKHAYCLRRFPTTLFIEASMFLVNPLPCLPAKVEGFRDQRERVIYNKTGGGGLPETRLGPNMVLYHDSDLNRFFFDVQEPLQAFNRRTRFVENTLFRREGNLAQKSLLFHTLKQMYEFEFLQKRLEKILAVIFEDDYRHLFHLRFHPFHFDHQRFVEKIGMTLNETNAMRAFEQSTRSTFNFLPGHVLVVCTGSLEERFDGLRLAMELSQRPGVLVYWDDSVLPRSQVFTEEDQQLPRDLRFLTEVEYRIIAQSITYKTLVSEASIPHLNYDSISTLMPGERVVQRLEQLGDDSLVIVHASSPEMEHRRPQEKDGDEGNKEEDMFRGKIWS